jgi:predicted TIM-barrel fold metal-dependent hydrolase
MDEPAMLGARVLFVGPRAPWLTDGTADWFWPAAEKAQVPVMFFAPGQVSRFALIAERHPQLTLIMDHMCLTATMTKDNTVAAAVDEAVALAKYPNMSVKLSASPAVSADSYPFRDVTVHLKRVFDAYGPQRSYWGTDITNSFAKASYRQRVTHFTEELSFLSESDKDWVMGRAILARLKWL